MTQITNGRVVYQRRMKTGEYEHRDVLVELAFGVDEGDTGGEALLERVGALAQVKCEQLVTGKPLVVDPAAGKAPTKTGNPVGRPRKEPQVDTAPVKPAADPAQVGEDVPLEDAGSVQPGPSAEPTSAITAADPSAVVEDDLMSAAPVEITDKRLNEECMAVNGKLKDAMKIRTLIAEFVGGPPKNAYSIPQSRRQEFIDKLRALA